MTVAERLELLQQRLDTLPSSASAATLSELEAEARDLLAQSKNTEYEQAARDLFTRLARQSAPTASRAESSEVRALLRRARIRIDVAGSEQDIDEAIDILAQALDLDPQNSETQQLLGQAAQHSSQHALKVQGLLDRYGIVFDAPAAPVVTSAAPAFAPARPAPKPAAAKADDSDPMSALTQAYYAGDYQKAVEAANRVLAADPNNAQAAEYRQKAEDNLLRGIVPDHRIPFEARVAYNRANSLVRAGNYDEAQSLYREARELAARAGIKTWSDVEQALLDIQDLALARELLNEGDRLLAADDWEGALRKYEGALRVVPNDPMAEDRIALINRVKSQFDQAAVQLNMMSGSLLERTDALNRLLQALTNLRQTLPGSDRLQQLTAEINHRLDSIKAQLTSQAANLLTRSETASSIEEKAKLSQEARQLLSIAVNVDPTDPGANSSLQRAEQIYGEINEARQLLEKATALTSQNQDNELAQARTLLTGLRQYASDPRYRGIVADLLAVHIDRIEQALDQGDYVNAERWLTIAKEDPFRILGRRTEILRLQDEIRKQRRGVLFQRLLIGAGLVGVVVLLLLMTQNTWEAAFFPTATMTNTPTSTAIPPTATYTATASYTPSATPTDTATFTPTPTASHTPTATYTPSITPTPTDTPTITPTPSILCRISINENVFVRTRPSQNAQQLIRALQGQEMDVLQARVSDTDGQVWYEIRYSQEGSTITGWIRSGTYITEFDSCSE